MCVVLLLDIQFILYVLGMVSISIHIYLYQSPAHFFIAGYIFVVDFEILNLTFNLLKICFCLFVL